MIGRPRGRNHFWKMFQEAQKNPKWSVFYPWPSWMIMSDQEIEDAKKELDELSFKQEYGGEFVESSEKAYYGFSEEHKYDEPATLCARRLSPLSPQPSVAGGSLLDKSSQLKMGHERLQMNKGKTAGRQHFANIQLGIPEQT